MKKSLFAIVAALVALGALVTSVSAAVQWSQYNSTSTVVQSRSGYALVTDGKAQTGWFGLNDTVSTSDGGKVVILQEAKNGKLVGPNGWRYEGPAGNRSGALQAPNAYFPIFSDGSSVTLVNGKVAIVTNNKIVSGWYSLDQIILTAEGGRINVVNEVKDGKNLGPRGWTYTGPDGKTASGFFTNVK